MKNKAVKGQYPYISQKKKQEVLKTLLFFGLSAAIFILGYVTTKTKANLLTIVAVLGCLPASKSTVSMIMHFRQKGCSEELHNRLTEAFGPEFGIYSLYFTSYDKNYDISHLVITDLSVIALTENTGIKAVDFEGHIKDMLSNDGISGINVKLYQDAEKYIARLKQIEEKAEASEEDQKGRGKKARETLFNVSLD